MATPTDYAKLAQCVLDYPYKEALSANEIVLATAVLELVWERDHHKEESGEWEKSLDACVKKVEALKAHQADLVRERDELKLMLGSSKVYQQLLVAHERLVGPIPSGMVLDHQCETPSCVNPDHLRPKTQKANILRGKGWGAVNARKTHCKEGHILTAGKVGRKCRVCKKDYDARRTL